VCESVRTLLRLRPRMRTHWLLSLLCLSALNCGPYLQEVRTGETQQFATAERCMQGPLRLSTTLDGARWGEYVRMTVTSPRALAGQVRLLVDDQVIIVHDWKTTHEEPAEKGSTRSVVDPLPANQHCVERPAEGVGTQAALTVSGNVPGVLGTSTADEWATLPAGGTAALTSPTFVAKATEQRAISVDGDFIPSSRTQCGGHRADLLLLSRKEETRDGQAPFKAGAKVRIEIWSEVPNDFDGACFFAERGHYEPSGTEAEWLAELDKRKADRIREEHVREVDWRNEQARRRKEAQARAEFCSKHPDDCRPRVAARPAPRPAPVQRPPIVVEAPPKPQPHPPTSAPPPPVQSRPDQPVSWAEWIPGYWQWSGFEWVWLDGWWKVDEAKLAQMNAAATIACPAPKREAPPPPPASVSVEWHAGQWLWAGLKWVWLPGQWRQAHAARPVTP